MNEDLIDNDDNTIETEHKFKPSSLIIWYIITFIGLFFRISHWPGFIPIIFIGMSGISACSISRLISLKKLNLYSVSINIISLIWPVFIFSTLVRFRQKHPNSIYIFLGLTFIILVVYELLKREKKKG